MAMVVGDITGNPSLNEFRKEFKPVQRHEEDSKIFCLRLVNF